jgi:class 3 adenylate cyclase
MASWPPSTGRRVLSAARAPFRVSALAQPSEIMVSSTVKDLVAGSCIEFEDRGEHELKGVPGSWRLFAARAR